MPKYPIISFWGPKSIKDILIRAKFRVKGHQAKSMFCCRKNRCKICQFIRTGAVFWGSAEKCASYINHHFECNSQWAVYLITCKKCKKQYVSSTITAFQTHFNNHKSWLSKFGKGQSNICGEQLYSHFFSDGDSSLTNIPVQVIDLLDMRDFTVRKGFWIYKLNCCAPLVFNSKDL